MQVFESASDVPDPRDVNPATKNLMVFDDLHLERQNKSEAYYTGGRHSNIDCFYLAENHFSYPPDKFGIVFLYPTKD